MFGRESKPARRANGAADLRRANDEHAQTDQLEERREGCQSGYDVQGAGVPSFIQRNNRAPPEEPGDECRNADGHNSSN